MTVLVDIVQLEVEINRWLADDPPVDGELSPALAALAEIYARMIFERRREIDVEALPEAVRGRLLARLDGAGSSVGGDPPEE